jgi:hypothetical protein
MGQQKIPVGVNGMTKNTVGVNGIDPVRQGINVRSIVAPNVNPIGNHAIDRQPCNRSATVNPRSIVAQYPGEPGECHSPLRDFSSSIAINKECNSNHLSQPFSHHHQIIAMHHGFVAVITEKIRDFDRSMTPNLL